PPMRGGGTGTARRPSGRMITAVVVAIACSAGLAVSAWALSPIRIALADGVPFVEIGVGDAVTVLDPNPRRMLFSLPGPPGLRIVPSGPGLALVGAPRIDQSRVRLETRRGPLRVGTRDYIGALEVWRQGDALLLVDELPMEEYVAGTVRGEASERWPIEALRALAVVARTYALFQQGRAGAKPYHVVAGNQDQNFTGWVTEGSPARDAAFGTAGQVLTWQGRLFPAFHHSGLGGVTRGARNAFSRGGRPPP